MPRVPVLIPKKTTGDPAALKGRVQGQKERPGDPGGVEGAEGCTHGRAAG